MTEPTEAAMRAAEALTKDHDFKGMLDCYWRTPEEIAVIIDRETGLLELNRVFEAARDYYEAEQIYSGLRAHPEGHSLDEITSAMYDRNVKYELFSESFDDDEETSDD